MSGHASLGAEPFEKRREARKVRTAELEKAGCTHNQAFVMALEEAWDTEVRENERLWDQADEIVALKARLDNARDENERRAAENARLQDGVSALVTAIWNLYEQSQAVARRPSP